MQQALEDRRGRAIAFAVSAILWLEPRIEVAENYGLSQRRLASALRLVQENEDEIRSAWKAYFRG